jgi:hypothetical protein
MVGLWLMDSPILTARDALKAIQKILGDGYSPGSPNENESKIMRESFCCLRSELPEKILKIGDLQDKLDKYLSPGKWRRYPGKSRQLAQDAYGICSWLESYLPPEDKSKKSP